MSQNRMKSADPAAHLDAWNREHSDAAAALLSGSYDRLRRMARFHLSRERNPTIQPTELVHEAYLRLVGFRTANCHNLRQVLGLVSGLMRRILIDRGRYRRRAKRGFDSSSVNLEEAVQVAFEQAPYLEALEDALRELSKLDRQKAAIVRMRFFGGLTEAEIARSLGCSRATVARHWRFARRWLYREMGGEAEIEA